jgi:hypothetical protein
MSPPVEARTKTMANMAMAQAVLEHAHQFYDVGSWYVVAECWDVFSVLEELDQQEERTNTRFELDDGAISHFAHIIAIDPTLH